MIRGFVESFKDFGGLKFIIVRGLTNKELPKKYQFVTKEDLKLDRESYVQIEGELEQVQKSKLPSYLLKHLKIVGVVHSLTGESLRTENKLTTFSLLEHRKPQYHKIIIARDLLYKVIRKVFENKPFIEITTPKLNSSYSEGGSELFTVTGAEVKYYLSQSPQLYKQLAINMGFEGVYEIGPIYRAEKFKTVRHLHQAICLDVECVQHIEYLKNLLVQIIVEYSKKLNELGWGELFCEKDFKTISYEEAIKLLDLPYGSVLTNEHQKKLAQNSQFVFVMNYPSFQRPFYIKEGISFDLLCKKGELCSGGLRQTDGLALENQMEKRNIKVASWYKDSFQPGCPTSVGFGFGLDRLIYVMLNLENIKSTKVFPL